MLENVEKRLELVESSLVVELKYPRVYHRPARNLKSGNYYHRQ